MFSAKDKPSPFLFPTTLILGILIVVSWPGVGGVAVDQNDIVSWLTQMAILGGTNNNSHENDIIPWVTGKASLGQSSKGGNETSSLVLAKDRTRRKDPTDGLHYYNGGWNISNKHYISSAVFTGFPLFLIAGIWFLGFIMFLLLACICASRNPKPKSYPSYAYLLSLILLVLFTVAAIIGSVVLYTGQEKLHGSTTSTLDYVVLQAHSTVDNLRNVSGYLTNAKNVTVDNVFLPQQVQKKIDQVNSMISTAADTLGTATKDNKDRIFRVLDTVRVVLIIVSAVMLVLALLGFVVSILDLKCLLYVLVIVGWILVVLTFIICGVFLVLHNVMGDTCVAMNEWVIHPTAHTALDNIIPCVEEETAQQALSQSKEVTFRVVQLVNIIIVNLSNADLPSFAAQFINYNQSGPLVPPLCNPYNPDLTNRTCAPGEVDLSNATHVWKGYVCRASGNRCVTVGRLTPDMYGQMIGAVTVSFGLHYYGPFLTNLVDCSFVRETFTAIHREHCPGMKRYSEWVYVGLAVVSAAVMVSLVLWVLYTRERRHRQYWKLERSPGRSS